VTIIRSVDEDEEEKYGDEETMEGEGGRLGDGSQEGRAAAASVPGSARTSRSSSSGTAPLCCRNCGSTEVVKKASRFKRDNQECLVVYFVYFVSL